MSTPLSGVSSPDFAPSPYVAINSCENQNFNVWSPGSSSSNRRTLRSLSQSTDTTESEPGESEELRAAREEIERLRKEREEMEQEIQALNKQRNADREEMNKLRKRRGADEQEIRNTPRKRKRSEKRDSDTTSNHYTQDLEARLLHMEQLLKQHVPDIESPQEERSGSTLHEAKNMPPLAHSLLAIRPGEDSLPDSNNDDLGVLESIGFEDDNTLMDSFGQMALESEGFLRWIRGPSTELSSITRPSSQLNDQIQNRDRIRSELPSEQEAWYLINRYYENYGWLVQPISRVHLINIIKHAYSDPCTASNSELSTIFAIFSLTGSNARESSESLAEFYELSMAALQLNDVSAETDLSTIEAMTLQCAYLYLVSESNDIRKAWNYTGTTIRMAYGIGLHHDPKFIGLADEECTRRRRLFHELVNLDVWQSMVIQRPPYFQAGLFSTEMPFDTLESLGNDPTFFHWKHAFCHQELVPLITKVTCATILPPYTTVLEVDKRIRSCPVPVTLQLTNFKTASIERLLQSQQTMVMIDLALIKLHKEYFIRAIEEDPQDPMKNYAAHSVTTVIESASSLLKRLRTISVDCDRIISRLNYPWENALAALSYLSLFIRRVSEGAIAKQLYIEFEMGCKLVADHSSDTPRASKLMPHVVELRRTVHEAAPELMEELRRVLSDRKKGGVSTVPVPTLALEYPLPPPVVSSFPPLHPLVNPAALPNHQKTSDLLVPTGTDHQSLWDAFQYSPSYSTVWSSSEGVYF